MTEVSAIVIGAGIIGTACALQLARAGVRVRLIDPEEPGSACSSGNAGSISEESIVPMALPGMLAKVPGWLMDPEAPLHVRWRYVPRAAPWLLRWIVASSESNAAASAAALRPFLSGAVDAYADLLGAGSFDALVRRRGQLIVWESTAPSRSERAAHALRERHGVAMRWLGPAEIAEIEPNLAGHFARGLLLERHGQVVDPKRVVSALARDFIAVGGAVVRARVARLVPTGAGGRVILDDGSELGADRIVVSAGAWSRELARQAGVNVPLETERGYHAMIDGAAAICSRPVMHGDLSFIATPMADGLRIAGTVEIAGLSAPPDYRRAQVLLAQARRMFRGLDTQQASYWMGLRPSVPDSVPVIGEAPSAGGILFAFGHGHLGMTGAPATARIIRDLALDRKPNIDLAPFRPDRFRGIFGHGRRAGQA